MHPRAVLVLLVGAALMSTGGAAIKLCGLTSWQVAGFRSAVAAMALLWLMPVTRRDFDRTALLSGVAYAATMILFVLANKLTTSANAIFLQSTAPLYILLLAPRLLGEPIRRADLAVVAAMAVGLCLFFVGEQPAISTAPDPLRGNLIGAVDGLTWALTIMALRSASRDPNRSAGATLVTGNVIAFLVCLPMAVPVEGASTADWAIVVYLGVVQIALAYVCVSNGLRQVTALQGMLLLLLEPLLNPVWAAIIHGETPGAWSLVGGVIVLAASVANGRRR